MHILKNATYKIVNCLFCNSFREIRTNDLARKTGIHDKTVGVEIRNLRRRDLVILTRNDKRAKYWRLNEKGKELARAFLKIKEILEVEDVGEIEEAEQKENVLQN